MTTIFYGFFDQEVEFICPCFGPRLGHVTCLDQWGFIKHDGSRRLKSASAQGLLSLLLLETLLPPSEQVHDRPSPLDKTSDQ